MHSLNLQRVWLLLRRRFLLQARNAYQILVPALLIFGFAVLTTFAESQPSDSDDAPFYFIWYGIFTCVIGFLGTTNGLPEHKSPDGRQSYLTLPASDTEKWVATYLYTGPIFFIAFSLVFWLLTLLTSAILSIWDFAPYAPLDLFSEQGWALTKAYFIGIHPTAMLGAITFNRFASAKTAGTSMLFAFACAILTTLAVRVVFYEQFTGFMSQVDGVNVNVNINPVEQPNMMLPIIGLAGLLLAASYFRFHEKQV